jgi:putative membrane protein
MIWYMHGMGAGLVLLNLFLWLLLVVAAAVFINVVWGRRPGAGTPEQILARRFARGEIDDEEYRRRMEQLRL